MVARPYSHIFLSIITIICILSIPYFIYPLQCLFDLSSIFYVLVQMLSKFRALCHFACKGRYFFLANFVKTALIFSWFKARATPSSLSPQRKEDLAAVLPAPCLLTPAGRRTRAPFLAVPSMAKGKKAPPNWATPGRLSPPYSDW